MQPDQAPCTRTADCWPTEHDEPQPVALHSAVGSRRAPATPSFRAPCDRATVQRAIWNSGLITAAVDPVVLKRRIHGMNTVIKKKHRRSDYLKVRKSSLDRGRKQQTSYLLDLVDLGS